VSAAAIVVMMLVPTAIVAGSIYHEAQKRRRFIEAFQSDPEFVAIEQSFWRVELRTRHGRLESRLWPSSTGGKNSRPTWEARVERVALGGLTTLQLGREGFFGAIRDAIGLKDIQLGDAAFDKRFTIRGADDELIRGVLADGATRDAVSALFADDRVMSCRLDRNKQLAVRMYRRRFDEHEARDIMGRVRHLAACLDRGENATPLPPPGERVPTDLGGVGGNTGRPRRRANLFVT
jgi:hypothetical protein